MPWPKLGATHNNAIAQSRLPDKRREFVGCLLDVTYPNIPGVWTKKRRDLATVHTDRHLVTFLLVLAASPLEVNNNIFLYVYVTTLIGCSIKSSVQTFQPLVVIYRRGNFMYQNYWGCTSIYRPLSYPFRSQDCPE